MTPNETANSATGQTFILRPHRSLSPTGFLVFMGVYGAISFAAGIVFYSMGAWPVLGFCGLDVLLVYWAFRANYRAARQFERIDISASDLAVHAVTARGDRSTVRFNPYWLRVELYELAGGVSQLRLMSKGRSLVIGRFLGDPERRDLALALRQAIASVARS